MLLKLVTYASVLFLVSPLVILIVLSFNSGRTVSVWEGFSTHWYSVVFHDADLWGAIRNTFLIAIVSTVVATILGTMAALALGKYKFKGRTLVYNVLYIPTILPEIIFGVSLLALFLLIRLPLGYISIICAHITFSMSFVTLIVLAKLNNFDHRLEEASLDLGAGRWQTFRYVVLPNLAPAILSGALFAFTLSIDDFIVTFFTAGATSATLPLKIYSLIKFGVTPALNAVSTVLIVFTVTALALANAMQRTGGISKILKWTLAGMGAIVLLFFVVTFFFRQEKKQLYLYNYAEYVSAELIEEFERRYDVEVSVNYFNDNEELLSRLQMGVEGYDLIFPTAHMVGILKAQGLIQPIDTSSLTNLPQVDPRFRRLDFDPSGSYSVPYAYGFIAMVYNQDQIKDSITSWRALWDEKYRSNILMVDDMNDVLFTGYRYLGYEMDKDPRKLQEVTEALIRQKPLLLKYENNMTRDYMVAGDVWIAQTWNGFIQQILSAGERFKMVIPEEGVLFFMDNMCIPKNAPNKETAELFINFLLEPRNAARNMEIIAYAMPVPAARDFLPDSIRNSQAIFPPDNVIEHMTLFRDMGEFNTLLEEAWTRIKVR